MAEETEAPEQATPAKSGGGMVGKIVNAVGILVLVIAGNIATTVIVRDFMPGLASGATPAVAANDEDGEVVAEDEPKGPPIYLALDPPLVASIDDGESIRFVQITVEVMSRKEAVLDAVVNHTPVIRNNLLMLLGRKTVPELASSDGKEKLRQEALQEVQSVLEQMGPENPETPMGELEDLYFTSFVVQ
jgi:flagellar FliL protein